MNNNRIKELRESMHMSQDTLGQCVGISQQVISKIERDSDRITKDNLVLLADFFNVSADYLLGRTRQRRNVEQEHELLHAYEKHSDIIQVYELLSEENQEFFRAMLGKMAELEMRRGGKSDA